MDVRVVETQHRRSVKRNLVDEVREALPNIFHVVVIVHVLAIDVRDDGNHRVQHQEGTIALIGFNDHQLAFTQPRVGAIGTYNATDNKCWVKAGDSQHCRHH